MPIDVHAHYVPPHMVEALEATGRAFGVSVVKHPPSCQCALHFDYGFKARPFFARLIEPVADRLAAMDRQGIDRQVLSGWTDICAYALPSAERARWHRFLNENLAAPCAQHPQRFSMLAAVPLPDAALAAAELDHAVRQLGAVGAVIGCNIEGKNLGDLDLDEFWQKAVDLDVGVFLHPVIATPVTRVEKFQLAQIAQYTFDTTVTVGSLIFSGVLDRFPTLRLLLAHGGGTYPYLAGRFDHMQARMGMAGQTNAAKQKPSDYARRFYYDTILHEPSILRWLSERVSVERIVLGSDYSFPPADDDPVATVRMAGFAGTDFKKVVEDNALALFPALRR
jgi:aminocarboxymuconate-semialdehyde decarboxylase